MAYQAGADKGHAAKVPSPKAKMVDQTGESLNHLFQTLADWEDEIKHLQQ